MLNSFLPAYLFYVNPATFLYFSRLLLFNTIVLLTKFFFTFFIAHFTLAIIFVIVVRITETFLVNSLRCLLESHDSDALEVLIGQDTCGCHIFAFFKEFKAINAMCHALFTIDHVVLVVGAVHFGEPSDVLLRQKLRAHISEEVDQTLGSVPHRAIFLEVAEFNEVLDLCFVEG